MAWMASRKARLITLAVMLVSLVGCDQASKRYATAHLQHTERNPLTYLGSTFEIRFARNDGAFMSMFSSFPEPVKFWLLTVMNAVILSGVAVFLVSRRNIDRLTFFALGLLVAGGVGNLIDRILLHGVVIDFMRIDLAGQTGIPWLHTAVFNVADVAITTAFLLMLPTLFRKEASAQQGEVAA